MTQGCSFLLFVFFFFPPSDVFSLTQSTASLPELRGLLRALGCCPPLWSPSQGEQVRVALGGGLFQRRQQALLCQVSLQGVEDVELLVYAEGQELLDDLGGVGTPERREKMTEHTSFV